MARITILIIAITSLFSTQAWAQFHKQRGATVGGLTGAIAGSLIGDNNGSAGAGAVIGGVVGAVTGGLIGDARDQQEWVERRREMVRNSAPIGSVPYPRSETTNLGVTTADVLEMSQAGLSDQIIINQIEQRGIGRPVTAREIIALHQRGVRDPVLQALQQAQVLTSRINPNRSRSSRSNYYTPVPTTTTIWMSSPQRNYCPPYYQPRYYYRPNTNFGFHFRF